MCYATNIYHRTLLSRHRFLLMPFGALLFDDLIGTAHRAAQAPRAPLLVLRGGRVAGVCPQAKRQGIQTGWAAERAQRLLPTAATVRFKPAVVQAFWEEVRARVHDRTPFLEDVRPGLLYFRASDPSSFTGLLDELGGRAGWAASRQLALLAAASAETGRLKAVAEAQAFLHHTRADVLSRLSVPHDMLERLHLFGLRSLAEVAELSRRQLFKQFGEDGRIIDELLSPRDEPRMAAYKPPPTVAAGVSIDALAGDDLWSGLQEAVRRVAADLSGRTAQRVLLAVGFREDAALPGLKDAADTVAPSALMQRVGSPGPIVAVRRILHEPVADESTLWRAVRRLWADRLQGDGAGPSASPQTLVTDLFVELASLAAPEGAQGVLFTAREDVRKAIEAMEVQHPGALLRLRERSTGIFPEERYELVPAGGAA